MSKRFLTIAASGILAVSGFAQGSQDSGPKADKKDKVQVVVVEKKKPARPANGGKQSQKPGSEGQ